MKKMFSRTIVLVVVILALITFVSSIYIVAENEHACRVQFDKIVNVVSEAGLYFKIPFIEHIRTFPKTIMVYDIPSSEVLTADQKNMTVDSYVLWEIIDPLVFYQTWGSITEAENRLNVSTYNELKTAMGRLPQNAIINQEDAASRNDLYEAITKLVAEKNAIFGVNIIDVKVKRLDLPKANEEAVYTRMISDRNQIAEKYTADGQYEASLIRNNTDKEVNIIVSNATAEAAKIEAEGEAEYMRMLAEAYNTDDKKEFYEFQLALEALKASLRGDDKVVILGKDSRLGRLLINP
ncbi:MAG: protease modulator HflC [Oscillospiraceae bacterium]|nr:protease modulator HflC [Oscillospiraceae bacterium]